MLEKSSIECDYSSIEYIILLYLYILYLFFLTEYLSIGFIRVEANVFFILFSKIAFHFSKLQYISWSARSLDLNIIELL